MVITSDAGIDRGLIGVTDLSGNRQRASACAPDFRKTIDISAFTRKYVPVNLKDKEEVILDILRQEEMYGLEMIERSGGSLKEGTIYVHLSRMEARGLIEGHTGEPQEVLVDFGRSKVELPGRRRYRATEEGWQTFLTRHNSLPRARVV